MYLSRLTFNPLNALARSDISSPYELHRTLLKGFPAQMSPDERVLFRLEAPVRSGENDRPYVLVQSQEKPDWSVLEARGYDYLLETPVVKSLAGLQFREGQVLRFRLRANPSKRLMKSRKRVGIYKQEERIAWLQRKGMASGFDIDGSSLVLREGGVRRFAKKAQDRVFKITMNAVDFDGWLYVRDVVHFTASMKHGIGPAKGLGCGLLTVAKG